MMRAVSLGFALAWMGPPGSSVVDVRAWDAPPECPSAQVLKQAVALRLTGTSGSSPVAIDIAISSSPAGYRAHLVLEGENGRTERTFDGESGEVVVDAISLITAINIDPSAETGVVIDAEGGNVTEVVPAEPVPDEPVVDVPDPVNAAETSPEPQPEELYTDVLVESY